MPKSLTIGNGNMLVGLDQYGQVADFYFPRVGLENHIGRGMTHRIGVWTGGSFRWLEHPSWKIQIDCGPDTFASDIVAENNDLEVTLRFTDVVYNEKNVLLRRVEVQNLGDAQRTVKVFFHQAFELAESHRSDTAYFDPETHSIIHYKGQRVMLINAYAETRPFDDYSVGLFQIEGREGTWRDAEDGGLEKNPIEHGRVDSVVSLSVDLGARAAATVFYWIATGFSRSEVCELNQYVLTRSPEHLLQTTKDFWHAWVTRQNFSFYGLPDDVVNLFRTSLFFVRVHTDNRGAILASSDSDMLQYGRDTYSYMWPRDGACSALALEKSGDLNVARRFFEFCNSVISERGYFMHKFQTDGSLGSSWHAWIRDGKPELPIQEDETALVVHALWVYYEISKDLEFIEGVYNSLIRKAADFMADFFDPVTGFPHPSYDIWEQRYGVSTFTCAAKYGALMAAGRFAKLLGKTRNAGFYTQAAERVKTTILEQLYDAKRGMFRKMFVAEGKDNIRYDDTIDASSAYGVFYFGVLEPEDPRLAAAFRLTEEVLSTKTSVGGMPRYEGDDYYRIAPFAPPNPWFITTLWFAKYLIAIAKTEEDLQRVKDQLSWCVRYALRSGVLSEQLDVYTGAQRSAAPLTWSHSEFILTVIAYLEKLEKLGVCVACYPVG